MKAKEPKLGEGREKIWIEEIQKLLEKYRSELVKNVERRLEGLRK